MKKIISLLLCTLLVISAVYPAVSAESVESDIERFDDGSYMTMTYYKPITNPVPEEDEDYWESVDDEAESTPTVLTKIIRWFKEFFQKLFAKQSTVTKTKYCNYYDSDDTLLWSVSLKGTFTYNHRKAVCVNSDITCEIKDSDWKLIASDHREEGNSAKGSFTIRQYKLGVPLKLIEKELILTCDKKGNIK